MDAIAADVPRWLQTLKDIEDGITDQRSRATAASKPDAKNTISKWQLGKKIGTGSFGVIYDGTDPETGAHIAVKFESNNSDSPQLRDEYRSYKLLAGCNGISNVYALGEQYLHHYLVMDALGPSLEMLYSKCKRKFSLKTVCMLGIQMIDRIHSVHDRNLIYRDIKPQNFLMGRSGSPDENKVFIVDLGMCKEYIDPITKKHITFGGSRALSGTVQFLSNNAVMAQQQSRRDDLESVCLVLIYFLKDGLPWATAGKTDEIARIKHETSTAALCADLPPQFCEFMDYIRNLEFELEPDYAYLQRLLTDVLAAEGTTNDLAFDWGKLPVVAAMRPVFYDDHTQKTLHQLHKDISATRYRVMRASRTSRFSTRTTALMLNRIATGPPRPVTRATDAPPADEHLSKAQRSLIHLSDKIMRDSGWAEELITLRYSLQRAMEIASAPTPTPPTPTDATTDATSTTTASTTITATPTSTSTPPEDPSSSPTSPATAPFLSEDDGGSSPRTRVWRPPRVSRPSSGKPSSRPSTPGDADSKAAKEKERKAAAVASAAAASAAATAIATATALSDLPASPVGKGSAPPEPTQSALMPSMAVYKFEAPALEVDDEEEDEVAVVPDYHTGKTRVVGGR